MKTRSIILIVIISVVLMALLLGAYYYSTSARRTALAPNIRLQALLLHTSGTLAIEARSRANGCEARGPLPDHACTPGSIFTDATVADICVPGYTQNVRSVSVAMKARVYGEYGLPYPQERGAYEADHLVPLELGGNNDIANLFPEAARPAPGFREKDLVENYLHEEVCAGNIGLASAQKQIANDWVAVYRMLTPDELAALKGEFASWAH